MLGGFRNVEGVDLRLRGKDPVVTPVDQLGVPTYDELVLVARRERLEEDPEAIRLFLGALARGTAAAVKSPGATTEALLAANKDLDPKLTRAEVDATLPLLSESGEMDPAKWKDVHRLDAGERADLRPARDRRSAQQRVPSGRDPRVARSPPRAAGVVTLSGGKRAREEVALGEVAAEAAQLGELRLVLDPLGDHVEREGAGHADHRLDDRRALLLDARGRRRRSGRS